MSAEQLSYVLVTPYSIRKSRTGGILSRLISRTGLDLVRARMFAPSKELAEAYAAMAITEPDNARHRATQERIRDYILRNFAPNAKGQRRRTLLLVFRGPNAVTKVMEAVGHIVNERTSGETIRDTYGDYVADADGNVVYFEPAVLTAPDVPSAEKALKLWAKYSDSDGGLLDKIITYPADAKVEQTLVLIKPDNFRFPNARPGGVLDVFSRSGLSIIGFKVHCMSVAEAEDFYGPVLAFLQEKFKEPAGKRSRLAIERELGFALDESMEKKLGEMVGPEFGRDNWEAIVEFMSGRRPSQTPKDERHLPGDRKIVAIIYQGVDAVKKIRDVLGPTDPSKAPSGTIRKEFGNSIMVNAAHASDSPESAAREMPIVGIQKNNLRPLIEEAYGSLESSLTSPISLLSPLMELAERATILQPSPTLAIDTKAKQMKAVGEDVCNFGAGEPDFDTPEHIKAAAIEALNDGFTKYTPSSGIPELRQAIADKLFADNGLEYKPTQIIVSTGAKQSCMNAILATCQTGDEVIIPAPYWVSYPEMVRLSGAEPVFVQTSESNHWKMTAAQFADAMTPRTKMVIINSPCNPTGAVYTREELEAIVEVADEEGIIILSDEMYEKLVYDDVKAVSIASLSKAAYELTITINGFSKAYAMTGWRLGYMAAPENIAKAIDSIQSHMTSNPTSFAQKGGLAALKGDQQCIADMRDEFNVRRDYVYGRISTMPNVTVSKPDGAFYVLVNIERTSLTSTNFADRLLSKQKVAVVPGIAFGNDKTIRISYATSLDVIKKGLDRLEEFLRSV